MQLTGSEDPYASSHKLLHRARNYGNVVERANRLLTSGPRTRSEVAFTVEKSMGPFSHLHLEVSLTGDHKLKHLDVAVNANLNISLPPAAGVVGEAFEEYYLRRVWPAHRKEAERIAATAVTDLVTSAAPKGIKLA